tara:strand:+ start:246 stop:1046 length:801 start_codon:yes stop_codon:yes gene_type:complete
MIKFEKFFEREDSFLLIAGPCAIEDENMAYEIAAKIYEISKKLNINFVFKGSFKKANRSRIDSFTGIGDEKALKILSKIGKEFSIPTTTDIHEVKDASLAANYVDILQIPAFLARQTDLIVAAAKTSKIVNIKKGQFMNASSMKFAVDKVKNSGNNNIMVTERGNMFGYQDLVVDFRGIPKMKEFAPVILDVTHSLQQPNQSEGVTGGNPELIETIAKAGIAAGVDGLFIETHPSPTNAKSDGKNMLPIEKLENLLIKLLKIKSVS